MARMKQISQRTLHRGEVIRDRAYDSLVFESVEAELGPPDDLRPTIERVQLARLRVKRSRLAGLILRDVEMADVKFDSVAVINSSIEFERVTLRGQIGPVVFANVSPGHPAPGYKEHLRRVDETSDTWSLDLSEAIGDIEVRGYAGRRLKLDASRQTYVPRSVYRTPEWAAFTDRGLWASEIAFAEAGDHDLVILANPRSRYFDDYMSFIQLLRERGFAQ